MEEETVEGRAFSDLDTIEADAQNALNALARDDTQEAQRILHDIQSRAEAWSEA